MSQRKHSSDCKSFDCFNDGSKEGFLSERSNCVGKGFDNLEAVLKGKIQLVYVSPESLIGNEKIRKMLLNSIYSRNLVAFVVDEAHCVRMW